MHRLIRALALLVLTACAAPPPAPVAAFRDPAAPIWSAAAFDRAAFLSGPWAQLADFQTAGAAGCGPGRLEPAPDGTVRYRLCLAGREVTGTGLLQFTGAGRFVLDGVSGELWILWADADLRTLVIGTPSGAFGMILNRGALPADRLAAAREILDFNGYDLSALRLLE